MSENIVSVLPTVNGMLTTTPTKTGARRLQLQSKRDFVAAAKSNGLGTADAQRAFDAYRIKTLSEFNVTIGQKFASGELRADRVTQNAEGELTTIGLVRKTRSQKDKAQAARATYLASLTPEVRAAMETAESIALKAAKPAPAIEMQTAQPTANAA